MPAHIPNTFQLINLGLSNIPSWNQKKYYPICYNEKSSSVLTLTRTLTFEVSVYVCTYISAFTYIHTFAYVHANMFAH